MTVAHDVGRAINVLAVEGQLDDQVFTGWGRRCLKSASWKAARCSTRRCLTTSFPRAFEVPEINRIIVETNDPYGPYGAKEVGQGPIQCTSQAIANAVSNAIGVPIKELPITPERVLRAIRENQELRS